MSFTRRMKYANLLAIRTLTRRILTSEKMETVGLVAIVSAVAIAMKLAFVV